MNAATKDNGGQQARFVDPAIEHYEKALAPFHAGKWDEARKHFEKVIAESEQNDLTARARLYLEVCERNLATPAAVEDAFLAAVVAKNEGDLTAADELCRQGGDDERFTYLAASLKALEGAHQDALDLLKQAIAKNPTNRVQAFHDPDFESMRDLAEFRELFETA